MSIRQKDKDAEVVLRLLVMRRVGAGLSQQQLAAKLGWPIDKVRRIESGTRRADFLELRAICIACGTSIQAFVMDLEDATDQHIKALQSRRGAK